MATESSVLAVIRASRPNFRNPNDKMAFAVHASFLAAGYSLIATGSRACSDNPPTDGEEVGIEGWNDSEDQYGFVYLKSCKGEKTREKTPILVKCLSIGDTLVIDVLNLKENDKEPFHIQINVKDHVSNGDSSTNYGEMYKSLERPVEILNAGIFNKLEAITRSSASGTRSGNSANEPVFPVQRQEPPVLTRPPVPSPGGSDLYPGPGAGVFPSRAPGVGGGMLIGPNDPRWFPAGEIPGPDFPGRDLIPPGARFDPFGPPDVPGFGPGRFVRDPQRGLGRGGVHPDLQHFQDPDYI